MVPNTLRRTPSAARCGYLRSSRVVSLALVILLLAPCSLFAAQPGYVAIGDVHGDYDDFVAILQKTGLIDQARHWSGGETTLVQLGDLIDRGPKPRDVMDLVMALEPDAKKAGGRVVSVLGNHEIMNVMGDLRYVTPENYATFADAKSEDRRRGAWQEFTKWRQKHAALAAELPATMNPSEAEWMAQHPAGFVEQREAYGPNGKYGKWIRSRPAIVKVNGVLFVHGGLDANMAAIGADGLNARVHDEINVFDSTRKYLIEQEIILPSFTLQELTAVVKAQIRVEQATAVPPEKRLQGAIAPFLRLGEWVTMAMNGPFWFRAYDEWSEDEGDARIAEILKTCDAKAIVVGHTVQKSRGIRSRFGGKVYLVDTGMLGSYFPEGRASALEFQGNGEIAAQYMDGRSVLRAASEPPKAAGAAQ
ncbi:MAG: metallophosphoesterase [Terriglobales bacterium]